MSGCHKNNLYPVLTVLAVLTEFTVFIRCIEDLKRYHSLICDNCKSRLAHLKKADYADNNDTCHRYNSKVGWTVEMP